MQDMLHEFPTSLKESIIKFIISFSHTTKKL